jgi:hypothetical protein
VVLFFFGAFVAVDGFHVVRVLRCELLFVLLFQFWFDLFEQRAVVDWGWGVQFLG